MLGKPQPPSIDSVGDIANGLLLGRLELKEFEEFSIADITTNPRIIHIYDYANMPSLAVFLKLGTARMKLRNYGKKSERILKAAVEEYISDNIDKMNLTEKDEGLEIDHLAIIEALQNGNRAEQVVTPRTWKIVCDELTGTDYEERKILPTAAELNMKWPIAPRSPLSSKIIKDYLACPLAELRKVRRFGWKKIAVYVACTLHLHKQMKYGGNREVRNIKQAVLEMWQNSRLTDKEKTIIELRFGIQDQRKHTLAEIKEHFDVTRERIRQIESKALRKLRMSLNFEALPTLLLDERNELWERLTKESRLKKQEWMEPLEDRLGFEYQIALEVIIERKHRNRSSSALAEWLDQHFPNDETFWYKHEKTLTGKIEHDAGMNPNLMNFLNQI